MAGDKLETIDMHPKNHTLDKTIKNKQKNREHTTKLNQIACFDMQLPLIHHPTQVQTIRYI
jgi:hypothetical protein